jgi:CheY-like chemotaxis protein
MSSPVRRLILRAELHHAGSVLVTHTLSITDSQITLASTRVVRRGDAVRIRLSFPGLVEGFELEARATECDRGDGHGRPASATFAITACSDEARFTLNELVMLRTIAPPPVEPRDGTYRCLLVEDNSFIQDLFSFALEKYCADRGARMAMETAITAEDAWRMLLESRYDMAVIDHYLPKEHGADLIARIRADARTTALPVVAISIGGPQVRDASLDAGADLFLDKPLAMGDLFTTLDKLTRRRA